MLSPRRLSPVQTPDTNKCLLDHTSAQLTTNSGGSHDSPYLRFSNSVEEFIELELRKVLYFGSQLYYKGFKSGTAKWKGFIRYYIGLRGLTSYQCVH